MQTRSKEEAFKLYQQRKASIKDAARAGGYTDPYEFLGDYYSAGYKMPVPSPEELERQLKVYEDYVKSRG